MKKYAYILLILASVSTMATAQIKIGNYSFKDGSEYTGELKGRKPNGKGKTVFKNGDIYEGQYVKGKREGDATYTFHDGEKYVGQWYQDQQHGNGTFYFMNNNRYEGMWYTDYQQGEGTMYYYNGDIYVGNWFQDQRSGKAPIRGKPVRNTWVSGRMIRKTVKVRWYGPTNQNMKGNGRMICVTEKASLYM